MNRSDVEHRGRPLREVAGVTLLVVSVVVFLVEPLGGPVLLSLSGSHGLDVGDLVVLPFLVGGALLLDGGAAHRYLLSRAALVAGDLHRAAAWALVVAGGAFVSVVLVEESSLPEVVPHAGGPPLVLSLVSLVVLAALLADRPTCNDVCGAPLWVIVLGLLAGFAIDITHSAAGSVVGPTVLAALFLVTLGRLTRAAHRTMIALLVVFVAWDLVALVDPRTFEPQREAGGGGLARVGGLGILMCAIGILALVRRATPRFHRER